ncbi:TonB-dependent receptor plug domain-containing protein [Sphingomonas sp. MMS24-JH45]
MTGQRTEDSDDYAVRAQTTATRLPLSLRETPQSVSVVTRAQIEDFQLNDINALLSTVPGVERAGGRNRPDRSFRARLRHPDVPDRRRRPPLRLRHPDGIDRHRHLRPYRGSSGRGAPGLLSPTGNPSAVVTFVRKRPTEDVGAVGSVQYGSFDALRLDADVSVPLTANGNVRARAVGAYLDTDSYLDRYNLRRWTGYGVVEADLGPEHGR